MSLGDLRRLYFIHLWALVGLCKGDLLRPLSLDDIYHEAFRLFRSKGWFFLPWSLWLWGPCALEGDCHELLLFRSCTTWFWPKSVLEFSDSLAYSYVLIRMHTRVQSMVFCIFIIYRDIKCKASRQIKFGPSIFISTRTAYGSWQSGLGTGTGISGICEHL